MTVTKTAKKENTVMSVDAATVHDWIENNQALLVDVRETSEFDKEHIPGALLLPLSAFDPELFPTIQDNNRLQLPLNHQRHD